MKSTFTLAASVLLGSAAASLHHGHQMHHHPARGAPAYSAPAPVETEPCTEETYAPTTYGTPTVSAVVTPSASVYSAPPVYSQPPVYSPPVYSSASGPVSPVAPTYSAPSVPTYSPPAFPSYPACTVTTYTVTGSWSHVIPATSVPSAVYSSVPSAPVYSAPSAPASAPVYSAPSAPASAPVYSAPSAPVSAPSAPVYSAPSAPVSAPSAPVYSAPSAPVSAPSAPVYSAPSAPVVTESTSCNVCQTVVYTSVGGYGPVGPETYTSLVTVVPVPSAPVYTAPSAPVSAPSAPVYSAPSGPASAPVYSAPSGPASAPVYSAPSGPASAPVYSAPSGPASAPVYSHGGPSAPVYSGTPSAYTPSAVTPSASCNVCKTMVYTSVGSYGWALPTYTTTIVYQTSLTTVPVYHTVSALPTTTCTDEVASTYSAVATSSAAPVYSSSAAPVYSAAPYAALNAEPSNSGSSSSGAAAIAPRGDLWAMAYTPYANDGGCTPTSQIYSDLANISSAGFTAIRIYSTDCGTFSAVAPAAAQNGVKMILGVYIDDSGTAAAESQVQQIIEYGEWENVEMIVVGNEAIYSGAVDASDLAAFIASSKSAFQAAGFTGPVTTSEPPGTMEQYASTLCPVIDVVGSNVHPFFDANTVAADAGLYVTQTMATLSTICGAPREVYNLETGWPNQGDANGLAVPSFANQAIAIPAIQAVAGSKSSFLSFTDDMWKQPGDLDVEQYWGCIQYF